MVDAVDGGWWIDFTNKHDKIIARGVKLEEVDPWCVGDILM